MNKKDTLLDFFIYVLMNSDQCEESFILFFEQDLWSNSYKDNYKEFLEPFRPTIKAILTSEEDGISQNLSLTSKSISTLLTALKIFYSKESTDFTLSEEDIQSLYSGYLKIREYNMDVFITYYIQLIDKLTEQVSTLFEDEKNIIKTVKEKQSVLNPQLSKEYISFKKEQYKKRLFEALEKNSFQFQGFFDVKGVYIDKVKTVISYIASINESDEISYSHDKPEINDSLHYLVYQYLNYEIFNDRSLVNQSVDKELEPLLDDYQEFISSNCKLVNYLEKKGFETPEINSILNTLQTGKYDALNFRKVTISKQLGLFRFLYLFYIFDFFTEEGITFTKENDFENIFESQSIFPDTKYMRNQFHKYFKNIDSPMGQNYPFQSMTNIYEGIIKDLNIDKGKLKQIS